MVVMLTKGLYPRLFYRREKLLGWRARQVVVEKDDGQRVEPFIGHALEGVAHIGVVDTVNRFAQGTQPFTQGIRPFGRDGLIQPALVDADRRRNIAKVIGGGNV